MWTKEERNAYHRDRRKNHPEKVKSVTIERMYGISKQEYEDLYDEQQGCCAICGKELQKFTRGCHIDHDHIIGIVRGLLCVNCNLLLGHCKDRVDILKSAIKYLEW